MQDISDVGLVLTFVLVMAVAAATGLASVVLYDGTDITQYGVWIALLALIIGYFSDMGGRALEEMSDIELGTVIVAGALLVAYEFVPSVSSWVASYDPYGRLVVAGLVVGAYLVVTFDVVDHD